jgi:hypothetical protein
MSFATVASGRDRRSSHPRRRTGRRVTAPLNFDTEKKAKQYLEQLLAPYFRLQAEVWCRHQIAGNRLRIDYLAVPRPHVEFPFDLFGIEVKRSCGDGSLYNEAIKQAIHYTDCAVDDPRPVLVRRNNRRIERVYIFPARGPDCWFRDATGELHATKDCNNGFCVNRLAGKFHVGMIYACRDYHTGDYYPAFYCSADRQWCARLGPRAAKHNTRQTIGNGALRRDNGMPHDS